MLVADLASSVGLLQIVSQKSEPHLCSIAWIRSGWHGFFALSPAAESGRFLTNKITKGGQRWQTCLTIILEPGGRKLQCGKQPGHPPMSKENMMKGLSRVLLLAVMLSLAVLLTACGGSTASPTANPSATSPAPMTVTVTLTDFKIASDLTQFKVKVGVPYHFVVVNKGATEHELMIAPPMTAGMTLEQIDDAQLHYRQSFWDKKMVNCADNSAFARGRNRNSEEECSPSGLSGERKEAFSSEKTSSIAEKQEGHF